MKALRATCIVGAITFTGMINQVGGNPLGVTVPDWKFGSDCERRDARRACPLLRRAGGICRTWNSAWSGAWLGARGGFPTVVDGQS